MNWKNKYKWREIESRDKVKPGMMAKLVVEESWIEGSWVIGNLNKVYEVVESPDHMGDNIPLKVPITDIIHMPTGEGDGMFDDNHHICYIEAKCLRFSQ